LFFRAPTSSVVPGKPLCRSRDNHLCKISNGTNTCYIAAVMQLLFHAPKFREVLSKELKTKKRLSCPLSFVLNKFFDSMQAKVCISEKQIADFRMYMFQNGFRSADSQLAKTMEASFRDNLLSESERNSRLTQRDQNKVINQIYEQEHDPTELLEFIISKIYSELQNFEHLLSLSFKFKCREECSDCNLSRVENMSHTCMLLPIRGNTTLSNAINLMYSASLKCSSCQNGVTTVTYEENNECPDILMIRLMRCLDTIHPDWTADKGSFDYSVTLDHNIIEAPWIMATDQKPKYKLFGTLQHASNSVNEGHITALCSINETDDKM
jgi:hypothetical protein